MPGAWDGFELTVRAILGSAGIRQGSDNTGRDALRSVMARNMPRLPESLDTNGRDLQLDRLFPTPGETRTRPFQRHRPGQESCRDHSSRCGALTVNGDIRFRRLAQDPGPVSPPVCTAIRGIGEWTAEYVAMRALKQPDALPASDLGLHQSDQPRWQSQSANESEGARRDMASVARLCCTLIMGLPGGLRRLKRCTTATLTTRRSATCCLPVTTTGWALIGLPEGQDAARPRSLTGSSTRSRSSNVRRQLDEYFAGARKEFDLPLQPDGH